MRYITISVAAPVLEMLERCGFRAEAEWAKRVMCIIGAAGRRGRENKIP
jgi:hypothetical protein